MSPTTPASAAQASWSRPTPSSAAQSPAAQRKDVDVISLGRRVRHLRKSAGLTLDELGAAVGAAASQLSLIENGKREPKLGLLQQLAGALGVGVDALLGAEPPSRRAALEIELERYQRSPLYESLNLPKIRISSRTPLDVLEAQLGLLRELERKLNEQVATPEEARRANGELRRMMRERGNYFPEYEAEAQKVLTAVGYAGGPLSQHLISDIARHLGFTLQHVGDLPHSTRSVTDLKNRRIYLTHNQRSDHDPRSVLLQALGHYVLGHETPSSYGDFLAQRVATNYFAAALLLPEHTTVEFLQQAKTRKEISVEDLRDAFAVSYETAAHRFTNLATRHLGITTHFQKTHQSGIIYKAYENDGVNFPMDHTGAIEGQPACKAWTSRAVFDVPDKFSSYSQYTDTVNGTFWCTARTERSSGGEFSLSVGVPYQHVKWFRGRETTARATSRCPDPACCRRPPAELSDHWAGSAWPSARAHSHLLAAMPPGAFPGVDETEVYAFLEAHSGA